MNNRRILLSLRFQLTSWVHGKPLRLISLTKTSTIPKGWKIGARAQPHNLLWPLHRITANRYLLLKWMKPRGKSMGLTEIIQTPLPTNWCLRKLRSRRKCLQKFKNPICQSPSRSHNQIALSKHIYKSIKIPNKRPIFIILWKKLLLKHHLTWVNQLPLAKIRDLEKERVK